jgi:hypothetical protein
VQNRRFALAVGRQLFKLYELNQVGGGLTRESGAKPGVITGQILVKYWSIIRGSPPTQIIADSEAKLMSEYS